MPATCTIAHGNIGYLTHSERPGIESTSSWTLCRVLNPLSHNGNSQPLQGYCSHRVGADMCWQCDPFQVCTCMKNQSGISQSLTWLVLLNRPSLEPLHIIFRVHKMLPCTVSVELSNYQVKWGQCWHREWARGGRGQNRVLLPFSSTTVCLVLWLLADTPFILRTCCKMWRTSIQSAPHTQVDSSDDDNYSSHVFILCRRNCTHLTSSHRPLGLLMPETCGHPANNQGGLSTPNIYLFLWVLEAGKSEIKALEDSVSRLFLGS